jgi:hypothetical protein
MTAVISTRIRSVVRRSAGRFQWVRMMDRAAPRGGAAVSGAWAAGSARNFGIEISPEILDLLGRRCVGRGAGLARHRDGQDEIGVAVRVRARAEMEADLGQGGGRRARGAALDHRDPGGRCAARSGPGPGAAGPRSGRPRAAFGRGRRDLGGGDRPAGRPRHRPGQDEPWARERGGDPDLADLGRSGQDLDPHPGVGDPDDQTGVEGQ